MKHKKKGTKAYKMSKTEKIAWIKDAILIIQEYHDCIETLRSGRGFYPSGRHGHSVGAIIFALKEIVE